jgi:hypothetical protein
MCASPRPILAPKYRTPPRQACHPRDSSQERRRAKRRKRPRSHTVARNPTHWYSQLVTPSPVELCPPDRSHHTEPRSLPGTHGDPDLLAALFRGDPRLSRCAYRDAPGCARCLSCGRPTFGPAQRPPIAAARYRGGSQSTTPRRPGRDTTPPCARNAKAYESLGAQSCATPNNGPRRSPRHARQRLPGMRTVLSSRECFSEERPLAAILPTGGQRQLALLDQRTPRRRGAPR